MNGYNTKLLFLKYQATEVSFPPSIPLKMEVSFMACIMFSFAILIGFGAGPPPVLFLSFFS